MGTVALEPEFQEAAFGCWEVPSEKPKGTTPPVIDEFEHLYRTYSPRVYSLCLQMTGNPDEAEDLTQETFLRLYQKLDTFRGESSFYTWLRRLAINVVLLRFQSACWRRETSLDQLMESDPAGACPPRRQFGTLDTCLLGALDRINLQRAIAQLPPGFKSVLVMHDIQGFEHTEISHRLGCSIGTSKSQLHKARVKVRELLQETERQEAHDRRLAAASRSHVVLQFPRPLLQEYSAPLSRAA